VRTPPVPVARPRRQSSHPPHDIPVVDWVLSLLKSSSGNPLKLSSEIDGYARVSKTDDQDPGLQLRALKAAGCKRIAQERASGGRWDRPELHRLLGEMDEGDIVVVWKLDRLTRSLKDMLLILEKIQAAGAGFRSLTEAIDTPTPARRMMMQMLGSFAEFERAIVRERTMAGLQAARERHRKGGRRPKLTSDQRSEIIGMLNDGRPAAEIARLFRVHRATVGRIGSEAKVAVR